MSFTPTTVHVDQALSNISIAYHNPNVVFETDVFPVVPVDKQSDFFSGFPNNSFAPL